MNKIRGIATSGGVAFGPVRFVGAPSRQVVMNKAENPAQELVRAEWARAAAKQELEEICRTVGREFGDVCEKIFQIHRMMLDDEDFREAIRRAIQTEGWCAEYAVRRAAGQLTAMFSGMEDAYMRARLADVQDVGQRMLRALDPALRLCGNGVLGFVTREGSRSSYAAILARMLSVPAVSALGASYSRLYDGGIVIADGFTGDVVLDPDEETSKAYRAFERRPALGEEALGQLRTLPARTRGGRAVKILAKIWKPSDLPLVLESGAEGVGLFRTESLYRNRTAPPTEEEQYRVYVSLARQLGDRPLTSRTVTSDGNLRNLD